MASSARTPAAAVPADHDTGPQDETVTGDGSSSRFVRPGKWIEENFVASTLLIAAALAAAIIAINVRVDFYGVFHSEGEERYIASNDRFTKYVHALGYVPANFDALLIGSSISEDLDTSRIEGFRMYNASLPSASITEEALIVDEALARARFSLVIVCFDPNLLIAHGKKSGGMEPRDYWSALGSTQLFRDYAVAGALHLGLWPRLTDGHGVKLREPGRRPADLDAAIRADVAKLGPGGFELDPQALEEFHALLRRIRAHGARIVAYLPPVHRPRYVALDYAFLEGPARELIRTDEALIDFNDGSWPELTDDPESFSDGVHLSEAARGVVLDKLNQVVASAHAEVP